MNKQRRLRQLILLVGDLVGVVAALYLALCLREGVLPSRAAWGEHLAHFLPTLVAWVLLLSVAGFYLPERSLSTIQLVSRVFSVSGIAVLGTAVWFYLNKAASIQPKTLLALFWLATFSLLILWRSLATSLSARILPRIGVAFVGCGQATHDLAAETASRPGLGYEARLAFSPGLRPDRGLEDLAAPSLELFIQEIDAKAIGLIVVGEGQDLGPDGKKALFGLLGKPISFMSVPEYYELVVRRVPVGLIDDLWFLDNIDLRSKRSYEPFKRLIDIFVAILGLIVSLPLWPFIALAVKASSRGPVFFKQARLGRGEKTFTMVKFRTMRTDMNDFSPTAEVDPRVTTVGKFLRASRLDELPQLVNVLLGDMSFVGPRPERPELAAELEKEIPFYNQRHLVKPGLTGWDQVSGEYHSPSVEDTYKKLQYDLYYVKNLSPVLDLSVFLKTIMTVLQRLGR